MWDCFDFFIKGWKIKFKKFFFLHFKKYKKIIQIFHLLHHSHTLLCLTSQSHPEKKNKNKNLCTGTTVRYCSELCKFIKLHFTPLPHNKTSSSRRDVGARKFFRSLLPINIYCKRLSQKKKKYQAGKKFQQHFTCLFSIILLLCAQFQNVHVHRSEKKFLT